MGSRRNKFLTGGVLVLGVAVPLVLAVEATHQPSCDRACLIGLTDGYADALLAHNPAGLKLAPDLQSTENGEAVSLGEGVWKTAKAIPSRQDFADPTTGEAGLFGTIIGKDGRRAQFALHLKINRQQIQKVETVISPAQ